MEAGTRKSNIACADIAEDVIVGCFNKLAACATCRAYIGNGDDIATEEAGGCGNTVRVGCGVAAIDKHGVLRGNKLYPFTRGLVILVKRVGVYLLLTADNDLKRAVLKNHRLSFAYLSGFWVHVCENANAFSAVLVDCANAIGRSHVNLVIIYSVKVEETVGATDEGIVRRVANCLIYVVALSLGACAPGKSQGVHRGLYRLKLLCGCYGYLFRNIGNGVGLALYGIEYRVVTALRGEAYFLARRVADSCACNILNVELDLTARARGHGKLGNRAVTP